MTPQGGSDGRDDQRELWRILGGIEASLETVKTTLAQDRVSSAQYRTDMRKDQQDTRDAIGEIKSDLKEAKSDISDMKPKVNTLEQQRHTSAGVAMLASWIWWGIYGILPIIGGVVALQFQKWIGGK